MWCGGYKYISECNLLHRTAVKCFDTLTLHFSRKVFDWSMRFLFSSSNCPFSSTYTAFWRNAVNKSNKRKSHMFIHSKECDNIS